MCLKPIKFSLDQTPVLQYYRTVPCTVVVVGTLADQRSHKEVPGRKDFKYINSSLISPSDLIRNTLLVHKGVLLVLQRLLQEHFK